MNETEPAAKLRQAAGQGRDALSDRLRGIGSSLTFKAIFLTIIGICIIVWPTASVLFLVKAIGILLLLDGVACLFSAFRSSDRGAWLVQGIVSLAVGAALLAWPEATIRILTILLGVWALLIGASLLWQRSEYLDETYRSTALTVGIILLVIGAVLLFWPTTGVISLAWLTGAAALVIAALLFWLSSRIKGASARVGAIGSGD